MSAKKVSELSETSIFSGSSYVPVVSEGVTYKMSLENLLQKTLMVEDLSETSTFSDEAYVPLVNGGVTYKMSLENLLQKTLRVDKSSEIDSASAKTSVANGDLILLEDSAAGNSKKKCTKAQFLSDVPQVQTGTSDPAVTPTKTGLIFINTATADIFISTATGSSSDWKKIT